MNTQTFDIEEALKKHTPGEVARELGKRWEDYIRIECETLADRGLAHVSKNWEAPRVPGREVRREKSKPDFSGHLAREGAGLFTRCGAGTHVVYEAKSTLSRTSFSFANLRPHQREHLAQAEADGAIAFLYILDGSLRRWVIPPAVVERHFDPELKTGGSIPFEAVGPYQKQDGDTWLDTWVALASEGLI